MALTTLLNMVFNIMMLIPMWILAIKVNQRHDLLVATIGPLPEEIKAHKLVNFLAFPMIGIFIAGAVVDYLSYVAYNHWLHPFADLLADPGT